MVNTTRCDDDGNFVPLQCRRLPAEERDTLTGLTCYCVNTMTGDPVDGTMTRVTSRDDLPDCETRSKYYTQLRCFGYMVYKIVATQITAVSCSQQLVLGYNRMCGYNTLISLWSRFPKLQRHGRWAHNQSTSRRLCPKTHERSVHEVQV